MKRVKNQPPGFSHVLPAFAEVPRIPQVKQTLRQTHIEPGNRPPSFSTGEHELKFAFSSLRVAAVLQWVCHICQPDPEFPHYRVSTIYYDTYDCMFLREKLNSDYLKTKIRLRWYSEAGDGQQQDTAWLEIKQKIGSQRRKMRFRLPHSSQGLASLPLEHSIFTEEIPHFLHSHGVLLKQPISPLMALIYNRHRFFEPLNNVGLSIDSNIAISKVNRRVLPEAWPAQLPTAVLEVKGKTHRLPDILQPLLTLGCRKASMSKYALCYQHVLHET